MLSDLWNTLPHAAPPPIHIHGGLNNGLPFLEKCEPRRVPLVKTFSRAITLRSPSHRIWRWGSLCFCVGYCASLFGGIIACPGAKAKKHLRQTASRCFLILIAANHRPPSPSFPYSIYSLRLSLTQVEHIFQLFVQPSHECNFRGLWANLVATTTGGLWTIL